MSTEITVPLVRSETREGTRVWNYLTGDWGTVIHVYSGSMAGAVQVVWDRGGLAIERAHSLRTRLDQPTLWDEVARTIREGMEEYASADEIAARIFALPAMRRELVAPDPDATL